MIKRKLYGNRYNDALKNFLGRYNYDLAQMDNEFNQMSAEARDFISKRLHSLPLQDALDFDFMEELNEHISLLSGEDLFRLYHYSGDDGDERSREDELDRIWHAIYDDLQISSYIDMYINMCMSFNGSKIIVNYCDLHDEWKLYKCYYFELRKTTNTTMQTTD